MTRLEMRAMGLCAGLGLGLSITGVLHAEDVLPSAPPPSTQQPTPAPPPATTAPAVAPPTPTTSATPATPATPEPPPPASAVAAPPPPAPPPTPPAEVAPATRDPKAPPPAHEGFEAILRVGVAFPALSAASGSSLASSYGMQVPIILELGSRLGERFFVGGYGGIAFGGPGGDSAGECDPGASCHAYDFRIGAVAHYHFSPAATLDPWVGLGLGYEVARVNVENAAYTSTSAQTGIELPVLVGLDWRTNESFGVGPFAAAHFGEFFTYDTAGGPRDSAGSVTNKAIHAWLMVGVRAVLFP